MLFVCVGLFFCFFVFVFAVPTMKVVGCLLLLLAIAFVAGDNQCHGSPNMHSVYEQAPVLVNTTKNGKFYLAGGDDVDPKINLVHMYGSPYEMGYAFGELVGPAMKAFIKETLKWIEKMADEQVHLFPRPIQNEIIKKGIDAGLDLTYELTKPYTPQYFYDEMQGMADASGEDYMNIVRVNMIPELIQASCSMFGAWGDAIKNTDGTLIQLRALDWNMDGPFQKYPMAAVYHPDNGVPFMNVGYLGLIGSLTGYSSAPVGICEKVWINYDGTKPREGYPWHFLLRDILQFDQDIDSALTRISNAERTCSIFVGLGDGETNTFRAVEYSHDYIEIFNDKNFPYYDNHPLMNGLVYLDKHTQPSTSDPCFTDLLQYYYGDIDAHYTMQNITAQFVTGETHAAVYDYAKNVVYISNAGVYNSKTDYAEPACARQYTKFDMGTLFAEKL